MNKINKYKLDCEKYQKDINYRKTLVKAIGQEEENYFMLRPIIGQDEFKEIVESLEEKNFMPGVKSDPTQPDTHNDIYLNKGEFKANLHIHSTHSDGLIDVDEILAQAVNLANKNKEITPSQMPLIIALTDHDCISGVKEVAQKVFSNPLRYDNVRIVLGCEFSALTNKLKNASKPILIHTHMFCINPFDKELNKLIDKKSQLKKELAKETIQKLNEEVGIPNKIELSLEEVEKIHPLITKGQDEICIPMKKYTSAKILFKKYVLDNNISGLTFDKPFKDFKPIFKRKFGHIQNYKDALFKCLESLHLNITDNPIDEQTQKTIQTAFKIAENAHPTLTIMPDAFFEFESILNQLKKQEYGVFSIAHPARTIVKDINSSLPELFKNMFATFKQYGQEKALYYEGYYQSYNGKDSLTYLDAINDTAQKFNLIKIGGMDTHGKDITMRGAWF